MILFREPLTADIRDFLNDNALTAFSYPDLGCTRGRNVPGFNTDRFRIELGSGEPTLEQAKRAMRDWRGFATDWIRLCWPYKKIVAGTVVAVLAHHYGIYSLNAARVVYVVDEPNRFGYAIGSLTDNVVRGELLLVVYQEGDGKVYYEFTCVSRPGHWLKWVFYPLGRQLQNRFAQDSLHALLEALMAREAPRRAHTAESES